jgi:hypothetical protein
MASSQASGKESWRGEVNQENRQLNSKRNPGWVEDLWRVTDESLCVPHQAKEAIEEVEFRMGLLKLARVVVFIVQNGECLPRDNSQ